jgi:hypothetical protein
VSSGEHRRWAFLEVQLGRQRSAHHVRRLRKNCGPGTGTGGGCKKDCGPGTGGGCKKDCGPGTGGGCKKDCGPKCQGSKKNCDPPCKGEKCKPPKPKCDAECKRKQKIDKERKDLDNEAQNKNHNPPGTPDCANGNPALCPGNPNQPATTVGTGDDQTGENGAGADLTFQNALDQTGSVIGSVGLTMTFPYQKGLPPDGGGGTLGRGGGGGVVIGGTVAGAGGWGTIAGTTSVIGGLLGIGKLFDGLLQNGANDSSSSSGSDSGSTSGSAAQPPEDGEKDLETKANYDSNGHPLDGAKIPTNDALGAAERWLGPGYREPIPGSGRFVSKDGERVARLDDSDILGQHGGGPHINLERLAPNPLKPGRMKVVENRHVYLN